MGSGCCRVYHAPPHPARPLHCGSCWALGHHNGLSVGDRWRSLWKRAQKNSQGRRAVVSESERASSQHALLPETWENIIEVEEGVE